jgi:hypothetical protein
MKLMPSKKQEYMKDYSKDVTFIPLRKLGYNQELTSQDDLRIHLPKGKYDIHYVIQLVKILEDKVNAHLHSAQDLQLTLKTSLKSLRGMLETERDVHTSSRPVILFTCRKCKFEELIFVDLADKWQCTNCGKVKQIGYSE